MTTTNVVPPSPPAHYYDSGEQELLAIGNDSFYSSLIVSIETLRMLALFSVATCVLLAVVCLIYYYWDRHREWAQQIREQVIPSCLLRKRRSKQESVCAGFAESVRTVAQAIRNDDDFSSEERDSLTTPLLFQPILSHDQNNNKVVYKCSRREISIADQKTSETLVAGELSEACTLSLQFTREQQEGEKNAKVAGWSISGTNRVVVGGGASENVYVIEEGFVSARTGKGYWVERSSANSRLAILSIGEFKGDSTTTSSSFECGEFYTSFGQRGRYDEDARSCVVDGGANQLHEEEEESGEPAIYLAVPVGDHTRMVTSDTEIV